MNTGMKDILSGAILFVFAIAMFAASMQIEKVTLIGVSSGFVPAIVAALMAGLSLVVAFNGYRSRRAAARGNGVAGAQHGVVVGTFALIGGYVFFLGTLGFLVSTFVYLVVQIGLLAPPAERHWLKFAAVSAVVTVAVYYLFLDVFDLILPVGILG